MVILFDKMDLERIFEVIDDDLLKEHDIKLKN